MFHPLETIRELTEEKELTEEDLDAELELFRDMLLKELEKKEQEKQPDK